MCGSTAPANLSEAEIDSLRILHLFMISGITWLVDKLRKFDTFWDKAKKFLQEDIGGAVHDRRHSTVVHVAKAVFLCDLR